jgi:hypothetical protein
MGEDLERHDAPKRPIDLECDIHQVSVGKDQIIVLAGKLHGKVYELFVARSKRQFDTDKGIIRKVKSGHYDLVSLTNEVMIENIGKSFGDNIDRTLARLVSMSLRHGVPLKFIVEQLNKSDEFIRFDKSVSRVLKKYIKDGEEYEGEMCPVCFSKLFYQEGCIKCRCGWSKCG